MTSRERSGISCGGMQPLRALTGLSVALVFLLAAPGMARPGDGTAPGRVFILMVWDGLRPDLVNEQDTPTLAALKRAGTNFKHHHSVFPTVTMVNGAVIASGAPPGRNGILGDTMYFAPALRHARPDGRVARMIKHPLDLEHTRVLAALDGRAEFDDRLLNVPEVAREVEAAHGYVAVIGKPGPTYLFDHRRPGRSAKQEHDHLMFAVGDQRGAPAVNRHRPESIVARDDWYTQLAITRALPAAGAASRAGHPALIILWQQDPDAAEHLAGLGTQAAITALRQCDANLGRLWAAVDRLGLDRQTDLMVMSDHGFATIRMEVGLSDLLVAAGLKRAAKSDDIVVARNGGNDLVYLSRRAFVGYEARRAMLARIVDFAAAQDWSGPIFSHAGPPPGSTGHDRNLGWIPGTFSQDLIGIQDSARSPDLVISFHELSEDDNRYLTGPRNPAFALGLHGQRAVANHSAKLIHPVAGLVYADNDPGYFSTGMGMHGAAGRRELHNFCAAEGPDFRGQLDDPNPTGNLDIAPTIRAVLGLIVAPSAGRVLSEALSASSPQAAPPPHEVVATAYLVLQGAQIVTELRFTSFAGEDYLDDSSVSRNPISSTP